MELKQAIDLIAPAISFQSGNWADIGAGTGLFTLALQSLLRDGTIYAVDKNPHALWAIRSSETVKIVVQEADFTKNMELPVLDGIVVANALHYAPNAVQVLQYLLTFLKTDGVLLVVEYETNTPNFPWIPYPIPFSHFQTLATSSGLSNVVKIGSVPSMYSYEHIYAASGIKLAQNDSL